MKWPTHDRRQRRLIEAVVLFLSGISHLTLVVESDEIPGVSEYWRAQFTNTSPPSIHIISWRRFAELTQGTRNP